MATTAAATAPRSHRAPLPGRFDREQDLYAPVKHFLEDLGYEVKGEVRGCDVVAVRRGGDSEVEPPIVVELKLSFSLGFVLQGIDRLAVTDLVYLAAPTSPPPARPGSSTREPHSPTHPGVRRLCRRLGLGLLAVHPARKDGAERVEVVCDPCLPAGLRLPRKNKARVALLLGEHARRRGDPNRGGAAGGKPLLTAYRQEALRCALFLHQQGGGPLAVALVREQAEAPNAARLLYRNVYGWFEPAGRGLYRLTEEGVRGLEVFAGAGMVVANPAVVP
jgi:hypothetical protein